MSGAVALVVPEHTRDALFQLVCDMRANTPKDGAFLRRHSHALAPRTAPGWLALASALGFGFSGAVALACTTALLGLAGVWASAGLAVCAGLFLACVLTMLAASLCVAALVSGTMAFGAFSLYAAVVCSLACLRLAGRVLLGPPRAALAALQQQQQQQQPEKPTGALQAATGADSYAGSQRGRPATAQLPAAAGDALEPATAGVNAASTAGAKQLPRSLADSA
ncbi:hypothetical protein C2E20_2482 [Micractinium conductrix]|uniref:Uncharacterized protein n=1 Tax=Micractinium conductrix TaxID=554055 RepID=A0A2P6VK45_9CHLO|nr:hypothetical protein C2E20_2482 [Micractinium conductrix]|eukprot:PSC74437.1 hypothetical protein C2E20_2482 [Micractinium conductrix]